MIPLNLPSFDIKIKEYENKTWIFDILRKKYVVLTPEEWVRQHFINLLITEFNYPKSLIKCESGLSYNKLRKRSDIVVYNREAIPFLLIECKAPEVKITDAVFKQAATYNFVLKAPYFVVTNGINTFCCIVNHDTKEVGYVNGLPAFPEN
ncbi:MAG: type I restriction enzyme HsdR N-terminal domain-containing protein [Sporocytophaga sp.]|nr:type I restriction enzyme HsdR N-terminal domain-containing protein [Sporocytophaga sp.]